MRLSMVRSYGTSVAEVEGARRMFAHMLVLGLLLLAPATALAQATAARETKPVKMVVLGDSLSAGLGLSAPAAFPARLQKALQSKGIEVDMINAGVSGDTTSGGRDRLDWSVPEGTEAVIVELGANDALRGVDPKVTRSALTDILTRLQGARDRGPVVRHVRAAAITAPTIRPASTRSIPISPRQFGVPLYPFFLEGVATEAKLNQADGTASDRGGHRRHRQEHPARGGGISGRDHQGNAVEKQAAITLSTGVFPALRGAMLRRVT